MSTNTNTNSSSTIITGTIQLIRDKGLKALPPFDGMTWGGEDKLLHLTAYGFDYKMSISESGVYVFEGWEANTTKEQYISKYIKVFAETNNATYTVN